MPTVFFANTERVLSPRPINGSLARKVRQISARFASLPYGYIVLPLAPDPHFVQYLHTYMGCSAQVVVPNTINANGLSILHGLRDPRIARLVRGNHVTSYIRDAALATAIRKAGGTYVDGDPGDSVALAGDKTRYHQLAGGAVRTPHGVVRTGTQAIARQVLQQLSAGHDVYVRLGQSGGGLGNRHFTAKRDGQLSLREICKRLEGDQPRLWQNSSALVEEVVPNITWAPSVAFHTQHGVMYNALQVTWHGDYIGAWSPVPAAVVNAADLAKIGNHFSQQIQRVGYHGWANTDLGVTPNGLYGFEVNARMTGTRHIIENGQRLLGPWRTWRQTGMVTLGIDRVVLARNLTFRQLFDTLNQKGLLATRRNPHGVIISIPPVGKIAGLQVVGHGYRAVWQYYQRALDCVGSRRDNQCDHPLF